MQRSSRITLAVLAAVTAACVRDGQTPTGPVVSLTPQSVGDAANTAIVKGVYWLTPTLEGARTSFTGTFDPDLSPVLEICRITSDVKPGAAACVGGVLRTLSAASSGAEKVKVDLTDRSYGTNWKSTSGDGVDVGNSYRALLRVGATPLGWVDLRVVAKQKNVSSVPTGYVGAVIGHPFIFKWRIESGIPGAVVVTPTIGTINASQVHAFTASVTDLHGRPLAGTSVVWSIVPATIATPVPGSGTTDAAGQAATTATPTGTAFGVATVTAVAGSVAGAASLTVADACSSSSPDADGDRLPDCAENNTGIYVGPLKTGTDPSKADTDNDGISDGDEVLGTLAGLDLPAMGVSPVHRNLLFEFDWTDDATDCAAHSHRPKASMIARLTAAFAGGPVTNPDGTTGITVISDYGQGGAFTGGNLIADADGRIDGAVNGPDFVAKRNANRDANRAGYFHYVIVAHQYGDAGNFSSGQALQPGSDMIVSLACLWDSDEIVANTVMHEVGHNLNIRHGGFESVNYKPNYNSVMNYQYQFEGINGDCTLPGQGITSYSVGVRIDLDENNLDERQGVCGSPPGPGVDWNSDGDAADFGFAKNLNGSYDDVLTVLRDYNDWANLSLRLGVGLPDVGSRSQSPPEVVSCQNVPPGSPK